MDLKARGLAVPPEFAIGAVLCLVAFSRRKPASTLLENALEPTAQAPFLGLGALSADGASDRNGTIRSGEVDLGLYRFDLAAGRSWPL